MEENIQKAKDHYALLSEDGQLDLQLEFGNEGIQDREVKFFKWLADKLYPSDNDGTHLIGGSFFRRGDYIADFKVRLELDFSLGIDHADELIGKLSKNIEGVVKFESIEELLPILRDGIEGIVKSISVTGGGYNKNEIIIVIKPK